VQFARQWAHEIVDAGTEQRDALLRAALRFESTAGQQALLAQARTCPPLADDGQHWDDDPWLLGTPNGVVELRTGTVRAGRADDRITMNVAVPYEPAATCPRWEQFVREVFVQPEVVDFVHRAVGYSLTGHTGEQVLFLCYGTGSNGKGTFTNTLKYVLGDYAWNTPFATLELAHKAAIPNDVAALVSRRFVVASETNEDTRFNEARVKALTGSDPLTGRFLHGEFFEFEPVAKLWLSVNHKPTVKDTSHGFWRRMRLIPFLQRFAVDGTLAATLRAEAPGILAWAVRGCGAWQRDGLQPPALVQEATAVYERESDPLGPFLAEACELREGSEVMAAEMFEHYTRWAALQGLTERERLSATKFGLMLSERFEHEHTRAGKVYKGVVRRPL
jgi:putative DNA primase/helicase